MLESEQVQKMCANRKLEAACGIKTKLQVGRDMPGKPSEIRKWQRITMQISFTVGYMLLTCYRGAGVLQQSIDELQAFVTLCDWPLQIELIHNQRLAS